MRNFFKWSLLLGLAFFLVFTGFFWVLTDTTPDAPVTQRTNAQNTPAPAGNVSVSDEARQQDVAQVPANEDRAQVDEETPSPAANVEQPSAAEDPAQQDAAEEQPAQQVDLPADADQAQPPTNDTADAVTGDSYLGGRVLDDSGRLLTRVAVMAQYQDSGEQGKLLRTTSDAEGRYRFESIAEGTYSVSNGPVPGYGEHTRFVQAGTGSIDLVLQRLRDIQVVGIVSDPDGRPIPQVEVNAAGGDGVVRTGANGAFSVTIAVQANHSTSLRFTRSGFSERIEAVNAQEVDRSNRISINVSMKPLGDISYGGRVVDGVGSAVSGELVRLYSTDASQAQRATTDEFGNFEISGLSTADDWRLAIIPKSNYERYESEAFTIDESINAGDIVLTATELARISGSMVDVEGSPVSSVSLVVTPTAAPGSFKTVTADATGRFVVEEIAAGELRISTQAQPHMDISGISLVPGDDREVRLVMDKGPHQITGVVRSGGNALGNADLFLTWSHAEGGLTSTSFRETTSAADGSYRFTDLGQGTHQLSVSHQSRQQRADKTINVGSDSVEHDISLD